jgi:hypothetical protein
VRLLSSALELRQRLLVALVLSADEAVQVVGVSHVVVTSFHPPEGAVQRGAIDAAPILESTCEES